MILLLESSRSNCTLWRRQDTKSRGKSAQTVAELELRLRHPPTLVYTATTTADLLCLCLHIALCEQSTTTPTPRILSHSFFDVCDRHHGCHREAPLRVSRVLASSSLRHAAANPGSCPYCDLPDLKISTSPLRKARLHKTRSIRLHLASWTLFAASTSCQRDDIFLASPR